MSCVTESQCHTRLLWPTSAIRDDQRRNKTWQRDTNMTTDQPAATQGEGWSSYNVVTQWCPDTPPNCPHHDSKLKCLAVAVVALANKRYLFTAENMKIYRLNIPNFSPRAGLGLNGELHLQCIPVLVLEPHMCRPTLLQHHIRLPLSQSLSNQLAALTRHIFAYYPLINPAQN